MAAPTFDALSSNFSSSAASLTVAHTVGAGANPVLVALIAVESPAGITSVTYNGVALTKLGAGAGNFVLEAWYMINPPTGVSHDLVVNLSGVAKINAFAVSYHGGGIPKSLTYNFTNFGMSVSVSVPSQADDLVVDFVHVGADRTYTPGAGQTERGELTANTLWDSATSTEVATGSSTAMSQTISPATNTRIETIGFVIPPPIGKKHTAVLFS